MRITMGQNSSYPLPAAADAIAIHLSEDGKNYGTNLWPSWDLDIFVKSDEGTSFLGTINTVAMAAGPASNRIVAYAVCPGARAWQIEAAGVAVGLDTDATSIADAELKAQAVDCAAFGFAPGVYRPLGRSVWNGAVPKLFDTVGTTGEKNAPLANSRTDLAMACALSQIFGSNESGAAGWIMLFDANALPANGTQPLNGLSFNVAAGNSFSWVAPINGLFLRNGLTWALSTTSATLTVGVGTGARVTTVTQW